MPRPFGCVPFARRARRGCIAAFDDLRSTVIVPTDADFARHVLPTIERYARDPAALAVARRDACDKGRRINTENAAARARLIDTLVAADG